VNFCARLTRKIQQFCNRCSIPIGYSVKPFGAVGVEGHQPGLFMEGLQWGSFAVLAAAGRSAKVKLEAPRTATKIFSPPTLEIGLEIADLDAQASRNPLHALLERPSGACQKFVPLSAQLAVDILGDMDMRSPAFDIRSVVNLARVILPVGHVRGRPSGDALGLADAECRLRAIERIIAIPSEAFAGRRLFAHMRSSGGVLPPMAR
jgi:hypothetical protein